MSYEAYTEGRNAKNFAERKSGIIFPHPVYMQYDTYASLAAIWRLRKEELLTSIEINRGRTAQILSAQHAAALAEEEKNNKKNGIVNAKSNLHPHGHKDNAEGGLVERLTPEEVLKRKEEKHARRKEKLRQQAICDDMRRDELYVKEFYRWELKENLRERRLMREEDVTATRLRKV